jgi:hypothetical protein
MSVTLACPLQAAEHALLQLSSGRADMAGVVLEALLLLGAGRVDMAKVVLEALPKLLLSAENQRLRDRVDWLEDPLAERRALQGHLARELADVRATLGVARKAAAKPLAKPHERLAVALASGAVTAEQVAQLLKIEPGHAFEIASGRVGLSRGRWRRLLTELEVDAP